MALPSRTQSIWHGGSVPLTLNKAQGLLSKLRETPVEHRPKQTLLNYLATQYMISAQLMKARIADAEAKRRRSDLADNWLECIYQIGNVLGETLLAKTF